MILRTYPNKNIYGKYFLATEAPDDEEVNDEQAKPKRNVKVVSVKPNNRSTDFTTVGNDPISPDTVDDTEDIDVDTSDYNADQEEEPAPETNEPEGQVEDQPQEDTPAETEPTAEEPTDDAPDTGGEEDFTTDEPAEGEGETGEEPAEGDAPDMGGEEDFAADDTGEETGEEAPDMGGEEDFTADTDDGTEDTTTDDTTGGTDGKPGVEFDSTRKYNLYKEYMSLYNACDNYISKLENILLNDDEENHLIRISVKNLREIKDILSDYMTIRFQLNTYVQSLLFYQKMVVSVQLVFNILKSIKSTKPTK